MPPESFSVETALSAVTFHVEPPFTETFVAASVPDRADLPVQRPPPLRTARQGDVARQSSLIAGDIRGKLAAVLNADVACKHRVPSGSVYRNAALFSIGCNIAIEKRVVARKVSCDAASLFCRHVPLHSGAFSGKGEIHDGRVHKVV